MKRYAFYCIVFLVIANTAVGVYFSYDAVGCLTTALTKYRKVPMEDFTYLYMAYSLPNVFMPTLTGIVIDRVGFLVTGAILHVLVLIGCAITAYCDSLWGMIVGRVVYGLGGESTLVVQQIMMSLWFGDKYLSLIFGLNNAWTHVATSIPFLLLPSLVRKTSLNLALWLCAAVQLFSFVCYLIYVIIHIKSHNTPWLTTEENVKGREIYTGNSSYGSMESTPKNLQVSLNCDINGDTESNQENAEDTEQNEEDDPNGEEQELLEYAEAKSGFHFSDLKSLTLQFWCLCGISMLLCSSIYSFCSYGSAFLQQKYLISDQLAGVYMSIPNFTVVLAPLFGFCIDAWGKRPMIFVLCIFTYLASFLMMALTKWPPVYMIAAIGVSFAVTESSLYAALPLTVNEKVLGTAYGIISCLYNVALSVSPLIIRSLLRFKPAGSPEQYTPIIVFFAASTFVALLIGVVLWIRDYQTGSELSMSLRQIRHKTKLEEIPVNVEDFETEGPLISINTEPQQSKIPLPEVHEPTSKTLLQSGQNEILPLAKGTKKQKRRSSTSILTATNDMGHVMNLMRLQHMRGGLKAIVTASLHRENDKFDRHNLGMGKLHGTQKIDIAHNPSYRNLSSSLPQRTYPIEICHTSETTPLALSV